MKKSIIAQGAEAVIIKKKNYLVKDRGVKSYRLPQLDKRLRTQRTRREVKLLEKASELIKVPQILSYGESSIDLEEIKGKKLATSLDSIKNWKEVCNQIGKNVAKLHDANIIHGDLTTSNMILSNNKELYFIDFGLGYESYKSEDKAVDLHVLKEALEARHVKNASEFWNVILASYKKNSVKEKETLKRLEAVEGRGRYKKNY